MLAGMVITDHIRRMGIGWWMGRGALVLLDVSAIMFNVLFSAPGFVVVILFSRPLHAALDPRVRLSDERMPTVV
jgi:ABC-type dipeptide/oligopeptide/nickel transport system permease component